MGSPEFKVGDRVEYVGTQYALDGMGRVVGISRPSGFTPMADVKFGTDCWMLPLGDLVPFAAVKDDVVVDDDGPDSAPGLRAMVKEVRERHDVDHPAHYTWAPVEVIELTEWLNFNLGNVVKYCARADHKGNPEKDLLKARWYLNRELKRRGIEGG